MRGFVRRFGVAFVVLDLLVGAASAAVLHHSTGTGGASTRKMSAGQLEQVVARSIGASHATSRWPHTSCSAVPRGGWDYYCVSSDGSRTLYDVSGDRVTQRSDLQPYR